MAAAGTRIGGPDLLRRTRRLVAACQGFSRRSWVPAPMGGGRGGCAGGGAHGGRRRRLRRDGDRRRSRLRGAAGSAFSAAGGGLLRRTAPGDDVRERAGGTQPAGTAAARDPHHR